MNGQNLTVLTSRDVSGIFKVQNDNGSIFKAAITQEVLKALGIEYHTVPEDPNLQKKLKRLMTILKDNHVSITFTFFLSFSLSYFVFFPGGSEGKASACNVGDPGSIPGSGRSPGKGWQPTPVLLPGKSHGWRSLVGYSPWGCRVGHD